MKPVSRLHVQLGKSRLAAGLIFCGCVATACAMAWIPIPTESAYALSVRSLALIVVGLWAVWTVRDCAWHALARSVVALEIGGDHSITLIEASNRRIDAIVQPQSYVSAWITTIVAKPGNNQRRRAIAILPDMLSAEDFRQLRVLLRLGDR